MSHDDEHGSPATSWRIFWSSDLPFPRRVIIAAGNVLRRVVRPPHDCCGRPGEPGC